MKKFEYQARCGNSFYSHIEVQEIHKGHRVYKGIELHGSGGRNRFGKSRIDAQWYIEPFENAMLEMSRGVFFTPGIKTVKNWDNLTNNNLFD